jgi:predicted nucleic acid-binding protein
MRKVLLDTTAFARFLAGDEAVLAVLGRAASVLMSVFVLGELFAGFRAGTRELRNKRILQQFLDKPSVRVLEAGRETAEVFGLVKDALKKSGKSIPTNDVWIAAHALEAGAVLVTFDRHFAVVPGLRLWDEITEIR